MNKKGSATLVVILFSTIFMLYTVSTYADVRHMQKTYNEYEEEIINMYEKEYDEMVNVL
ncbi:MAG: hypothetical protein IKL68_00740 [Clostridia bacterium]|nr:hypothetical protein [Clostridia bacterium]